MEAKDKRIRSISYSGLTRLLSTGMITTAYFIHSRYLLRLFICKDIALHHIVSITTRHAVVWRIPVLRSLLVNAYSYARFSLYCVYTGFVDNCHILLECQIKFDSAVFGHLVFERIVLPAYTDLVRMRLSPCLTTRYAPMRLIARIRYGIRVYQTLHGIERGFHTIPPDLIVSQIARFCQFTYTAYTSVRRT